MKLSIIIPVYNEEATLETLLRKVERVPINKEIIVIDDCSQDNSKEILKMFEHKHKTIYQEKNQGKGAAIKAGLKQATGDIVVVQDADLEYDPSELTMLIQPILLGETSVVYGSRFLKRGFVPQYYLAYFGNITLSLLTSMLYSQKITDMETCYKMAKIDLVKSLSIKANGFDFEPEITAKLLKAGHSIKEVAISYEGRSYKEGKKINWKDGLKAIYVLIRYSLLKSPKK